MLKREDVENLLKNKGIKMELLFIIKSLWNSRKGFEMTSTMLLKVAMIVIAIALLTAFVLTTSNKSDLVADTSISTLGKLGSRG